MIELAILVLFIILIIGVILVYKKYVNVVNVINDEQNRKYNELSKLVGSNNVNIKNNTKNAEEILDRDTVDVQILQEIINKLKIPSLKLKKDHNIIIRSSIFPGTMEIINKILKKES